MLYDYSRLGRSFTLREIRESLELEVDIKEIKRAVTSSRLFVSFDRTISDDSYFISKKTLFKWFVNLNLKLAEAEQAKLTSRQLGLLLSNLRTDGRWEEPPPPVVHFGQNFHLVSPSWTKGYYVFPIARFFSSIPSNRYQIVENLLTEVENDGLPKRFFKIHSHNPLDTIIKEFPQRTAEIIYLREGFTSGKRMTFEQVGAKYGVTRERIRQIEKGFWRKIRHPVYRRPIVEYFINFINDLVKRLLTNSTSVSLPDRSALWRIADKYFGIPIYEVVNNGFPIIGISQDDLSSILSPSKLFQLYKEGVEIFKPEGFGQYLEEENNFVFSESEMRFLCYEIKTVFQKSLTKSKRVYLTLRSIGKPAHYSTVAKEYNRLFTNTQSSEHNIHAILTGKQNGIVWIGVKGTFALKEWGYSRPKQSLFTTTAEIVKNIYLRDKRPATFTTVSLAMGKYRKIVNPNSLLFAMNFNPEIEHLQNNTYIPKNKRADRINNNSSDELDKTFRNFEQSIGMKDRSEISLRPDETIMER